MRKKNKIILIIFSVVFLLSAGLVYAGVPGVEPEYPIDQSEDSDGLLERGFQVFTSNDSFNTLDNITIFVNESNSPSTAGLIWTENVTNDTTADTFVSQANNFTLSPDDQYQIETAGMWLHWYAYVCNNNSECWESNNMTVYYEDIPEEGRTPPTVTLISPADGESFNVGNFTFSVKGTDSIGLSNATIFWNVTTQTYYADSNFTIADIVLVENASKTLTGTSDTEVFDLNSDLNGEESITENSVIHWFAYVCNNASSVLGNCTYSENRTINIVFEAANTSIPTVEVHTPINGSIDDDGIIPINFTVTDTSTLKNATLFWNQSDYIDDLGLIELEIVNDTVSLSGEQINSLITLTNQLDNRTGTITSGDGSGFIQFYVQGCNTAGLCGVSENITIEVDRSIPTITLAENTSLPNTHDTVNITIITNEPTDVELSFATDSSFVNVVQESSALATEHTFTFDGLETNDLYYWNYTACDARNFCYNQSTAITYRQPWALKTGTTWIGVLKSVTNSSTFAEELNASYVHTWLPNGTFSTYARDAPELGENYTFYRGDGVGIQMSFDTTWDRGGETGIGSDSNGTLIGLDMNTTSDTGWNLVGLLQSRTPENLTSLLDDAPFLDNVTIFSWQNYTTHSYLDQITNRTRNINSTIDAGWGVWMLQDRGLNWTFARETGFCTTFNYENLTCMTGGVI